MQIFKRRSNRSETKTYPDTTLGRLRKVRNDHGNAALIGVLIALAITGLMLSIAGPGMLELLTDARGNKLEQNFQAAVSIVENRLRIDPDARSAGSTTWDEDTGFLHGDGALGDSLLRDGPEFVWATEDFANDGSTITGGWNLPASSSNASDTTIYVQFLKKAAAEDLPNTDSAVASHDPPIVPWLLDNGSAVRLQATNPDGRWVCALIMVRATMGTGATVDINGSNDYLTFDSAGGGVGTAGTVRRAVIEARLTKTWYDSGNSYSVDASDDDYADNTQLHHCSPVGNPPGGTASSPAVDPDGHLPISNKEWNIVFDADGTGTDDTIVTLTENP